VEPRQVIEVERLPAEAGATIEMTDILMLGGDGEVTFGQPLVEGARVVAEVLDHGRDKKIVVFKYKNKTRYRRKQGHRQGFTRLAIQSILTGKEQAAEPKPARAPRRRAATAEQAAEPKPARAPRAHDATIPAAIAKEAAGPQRKPRTRKTEGEK